MSELRWHPILSEWVITATHRQDRTFFPPTDYNPLAPSKPGGFPTEIPTSEYEIVVFENKFPSLQASPPDPALLGTFLTPVRPAQGVCEVVCYSSDSATELAQLPEWKVRQLIEVWADRFDDLSNRDYIDYVFIFENKGREIGVTLHHPHGQIYAYPFIPPLVSRRIASAKGHFVKTGGDLIGDVIAEELEVGTRVIAQNTHFVAAVPFFARFPYEVQVYPRARRSAISDFTSDERDALAEILKVVMEKYNNLWDRSMPYIMMLHQRPCDDQDYSYFRFHVEFTPPYRTPDKLKYLAGSEAGAGAYINDTLAEVKAEELRNTFPHLM